MAAMNPPEVPGVRCEFSAGSPRRSISPPRRSKSRAERHPDAAGDAGAPWRAADERRDIATTRRPRARRAVSPVRNASISVSSLSPPGSRGLSSSSSSASPTSCRPMATARPSPMPSPPRILGVSLAQHRRALGRLPPVFRAGRNLCRARPAMRGAASRSTGPVLRRAVGRAPCDIRGGSFQGPRRLHLRLRLDRGPVSAGVRLPDRNVGRPCAVLAGAGARPLRAAGRGRLGAGIRRAPRARLHP